MLLRLASLGSIRGSASFSGGSMVYSRRYSSVVSSAPLMAVGSLSVSYRSAALAAVDAAAHSYCPYSGFGVGAALLHPDGTITQGTNWENCVYQSVCAERTAIVAANVQGKRSVTACAVWGGSTKKDVDVPKDSMCTPCGVCRQMLNECAKLTGTDIDLILVGNGKTHCKVVKLSQLLPDDFGPKDVGVDLAAWADQMSKLQK